MKIQNNYNGFSGTEYHKPNAQSPAEPFNVSGEKPRDGAKAAGSMGISAKESPPANEKGQMPSGRGNDGGQKKQEAGLKKGMEFIRQFWDSMGEENQGTEEASGPVEEGRPKEDAAGGIFAVSSAIRNLFPSYITEKWEEVKDRVKESAGAAFRSFHKRKDAFLALSDPGRRFRGKKEEKQRRQEGAGRRIRNPRPEGLSAAASDTHLMDSYSKTGEYCRLNENLSYRREQRREENRRRFSEKAGEGALEEASRETSKRLDKRL